MLRLEYLAHKAVHYLLNISWKYPRSSMLCKERIYSPRTFLNKLVVLAHFEMQLPL